MNNRDIICRIGDPSNTVDLVRVGAHRASSILIMMTEKDEEEFQNSGGHVRNGMTIRGSPVSIVASSRFSFVAAVRLNRAWSGNSPSASACQPCCGKAWGGRRPVNQTPVSSSSPTEQPCRSSDLEPIRLPSCPRVSGKPITATGRWNVFRRRAFS